MISPSEYVLKGHTGPVLAVAVQSTGKIVASASQDRSIRLWSTGNAYIYYDVTKISYYDVTKISYYDVTKISYYDVTKTMISMTANSFWLVSPRTQDLILARTPALILSYPGFNPLVPRQ